MEEQKMVKESCKKIQREISFINEKLDEVNSDLLRKHVAYFLESIAGNIGGISTFLEFMFLTEIVGVDFNQMERRYEVKSVDKYNAKSEALENERHSKIYSLTGRLYRLETDILNYEEGNIFPRELLGIFEKLTTNIESNVSFLEQMFRLKQNQKNIKNFIREYLSYFNEKNDSYIVKLDS